MRDRRAYLFTMAANLATDHMRVEKRRGEILAETDGAAWRQSEELTPERHAVARAELAEMDAVLAALPALLGGATGSENLGIAAASAGVLFLLITTVLLVADLKRPERFLLLERVR